MSSRRHEGERDTPWVVDRRAVLGTLAAASAVSLLPLSAATAASLLPNPSAATLLVDWHIDDQWGVYPRHTDPIPYGCRATDSALAYAWDAF